MMNRFDRVKVMLSAALLSGLVGCGAAVGPGGSRDASMGDGAALDDRPSVSFEVPIICVTPDGRQFAPGSTIVVGPCNATCSCDFNGQVTCNPGECPPPAGCRVPDGSEIPVGNAWLSQDRCQQCICAAPGQPMCTAVANCSPPNRCADIICDEEQECCESTARCVPAGCGACCMDGPPPRCNQLVPPAESVSITALRETAPLPSGRLIPDGVFRPAQCNLYQLGGPPRMVDPVQMTVRISGTSMEVASITRGILKDANLTMTPHGVRMILRTNCGERTLDGANIPFSGNRASFSMEMGEGSQIWCTFVQTGL